MSKFSELASTMQYVMDDVQTTIAKRLQSFSKLELEVELLNTAVINYNGGLFHPNSELIGLINGLRSVQNDAIVLDVYSTPVPISDLGDFLGKVVEAYHKNTSNYHQKYKSLSKK
jgi:hypothetical protein